MKQQKNNCHYSKNRQTLSLKRITGSLICLLFISFSTFAQQEIAVFGNSVEIVNGDNTPDIADDTDFGDADLCLPGSNAVTFTIENTGTSLLSLTGGTTVALSGSADFVVSAQPGLTAIPSGGSTDFTITFTPSSIGLQTAVVSIENDDADENPYTFTISGTGTDTSAPVFSDCPADVIVYLPDGACTSTATWTPPTATDDCAVDALTSSHSSGDIFPLDTTEVEYIASDAAGNTNSCFFNVIVKDTFPPTFPDGDTVIIWFDAPPGVCTPPAPWFTPVVTDNCTIESYYNSPDYPERDARIGISTTTYYIAVDNSGNRDTCVVKMFAEDTTPPTAVCQDITIALDNSGTAHIEAEDVDNGSFDDCGLAYSFMGDSLYVNIEDFDCTNLGANNVTLKAVNKSYLIDSCIAVVTVIDTLAPEITDCPADIVIAGSCSSPVTWTEPTVTDNCGASFIQTHSPGDFFPIGSTMVTYTAVDGYGNTVTCEFTVTVNDTIPPVITGCPADTVLYVDSLSCGISLVWTPPTVTDICGLDTLIESHSPGSLFPLDTTIVTYVATDSSGNSDTCSFNVIVKDTLKPIFLVRDTIIFFDAPPGVCIVPFAWEAPPVTDNCTIDSLFDDPDAPERDATVGQSTTVYYIAVDESGNRDSTYVKVFALDPTPPIAICKDLVIELDASGMASITADSINNGSYDDCGLAWVSDSLSIDIEDFDCSHLGVNTVVLTVTNTSGLQTTCEATVEVTLGISTDFEPPALLAAHNEAVFTNLTYPGASVMWDMGDGTMISDTDAIHTYTAPGAYEVSMTASIGPGCEETVTKTVYVLPAPDASFLVNTVCEGFPSNFTDDSDAIAGNIIGWSWDFGDGTGTSSDQNPTYTYSLPGEYEVILTIETDLGFFGSDTLTAVVLPTPEIIFNSSDPDSLICDDGTISFSASVTNPEYAGMPINFTFMINGLGVQSGVDPTFAPVSGLLNNGDVVSVTASVPPYGCQNTSTGMSITVLEKPDISLGPDIFLCEDETAVLNAYAGTGFIYDWRMLEKPGTVIGTGEPTLTVDEPGNYYALISNVASPGTCDVVTDTVNVSFLPPPVVELGEDVSVCDPSGLPHTFIAQDVMHSSSITYEWYVAGDNTVVGTDGTYEAEEANIYVVVLEDALTGCTSSDTVRLDLTPDPDFLITGHEGGTCDPTEQLFIQSTNLTGMSIEWEGPGIIEYAPDSLSVIVDQSGVYKATVTNTSGTFDCSKSFQVNVIIREPIQINTDIPNTIIRCENDSVRLNAFSPEHDANYSYKWTSLSTGELMSETSVVTIFYPGVYEPTGYLVEVTNPDGGCSHFDTVYVGFEQSAEVNIDSSYVASLCVGESTTITASGTMNRLMWSTGDTTRSIDFTADSAGVFTFTVAASNLNTCGTVYDTAWITVYAIPTADINFRGQSVADTSLCETESISFDGFAPDHDVDVKYQWRHLNSNTVVSESRYLTVIYDSLPSPDYSPQQFELFVQDSSALCEASDTVTVTFEPRPEVLIDSSYAKEICPGESVTLNGTGTGISQYIWTPSVTDSLAADSSSSITITPKELGYHMYILRGISENSCEAEPDTAIFFVHPEAQVSLNEADTVRICQGNSIVLTATGAVTYTWSHDSTLTADSSGVTTVTPEEDIKIVVTGANENGCNGSDSIFLKVIPRIDLGADTLTTCAGEILTLGSEYDSMVLDSGTVVEYTWYPTGEKTAFIEVSAPGIYSRKVGIAECEYFDSVLVQIKEAPRVVVKDTILCFEDSLYQFITHTVSMDLENRDSSASYLIQWFDSNGDIVGEGDSVELYGGGEYTVIATAQYDEPCEGVDTLNVREICEPRIFIPDAFSPNGDGLNDEFKVFGRYVYDFRIRVFNRWGELVWQQHADTKEEIESWDGTFGGQDVNEGTYFYQITYTAGIDRSVTHERTGTIVILRF